MVARQNERVTAPSEILERASRHSVIVPPYLERTFGLRLTRTANSGRACRQNPIAIGPFLGRFAAEGHGDRGAF
jgi:hypothetical protein